MADKGAREGRGWARGGRGGEGGGGGVDRPGRPHRPAPPIGPHVLVKDVAAPRKTANFLALRSGIVAPCRWRVGNHVNHQPMIAR